jgi:hypothetical protein
VFIARTPLLSFERTSLTVPSRLSRPAYGVYIRQFRRQHPLLSPCEPTIAEYGDHDAGKTGEKEPDKDSTSKWGKSVSHIEDVCRNSRDRRNKIDHICLLLREYRTWRVSLTGGKKQARSTLPVRRKNSTISLIVTFSLSLPCRILPEQLVLF